MSYELKQTDIYGLAAALGADTTKKGKELFFRRCPYCNGGQSGDTYTFSVNLETGAYKCFRSSCDAHGHFVQLARDYSYPLDFGDDGTKRKYRLPPQKEVVVREPAVEYLASRGIGKGVAERYRITTAEGKPNILVFPFYDESGVIRFVKYRKTDFVRGRDKNKEWSSTDTMPILFGMRQCKPGGRLIITEGQLDSLSLAEAGIENAVSVPTGATGMTWVSHCFDWLMKFSELVIFGDHENGKVTLVDRIAERVPLPIKVVRGEDYLGEKDANDILRRYGRQALIDAVNNAAELITNHIIELADVEAVDLNNMPRIYTRIPELDRIIGGMFYGQVILLTGKRGEGKSTLMSQFTGDAIEQGVKTLAYSGELPNYHFKRWLDLQLAGGKNLVESTNRFGDKVYSLAPETVKKISEWYRGKMYIYDNTVIDDDECVQLLDTIEIAIQRHGIKLVCLDNLMTALDVDLDKDIYRAQSRFLKRLKQIATRYNIVVLLVAHPKKTKDDVVIEDISGSGDISNRVDVVLSYSRTPTGDGCVKVFKNRLTGKLCTEGIKLFYSESSKQITSVQSGRKSYGWETSGSQQVYTTEDDLPF